MSAVCSRLRPLAARGMPAAVFALFALVAVPGAFNGGVWAIVGIGGALLLYGMAALAEGAWPRPDRSIGLYVLAALGLVFAQASVALSPEVSLRSAVQLATILVPLLALSCPSVRSRASSGLLARVWPWLMALGFAALALEIGLGGPLAKAISHSDVFTERLLTKYNRGLSYGMVMVWPALAMMALGPRKNLWGVGAILIAGLAVLALTHSRTTQLGVVVGMAVWGLARLWPRATARGLMVLAVLAALWPAAALYVVHNHPSWLEHLPGSFHHRIEIWDYMAWRILDRPWLGWGLGASHLLDWTRPDGALFSIVRIPAAHPHNAYIQWWGELGLPGLALGCCALLGALRLARRLDPQLIPWALASWASAFVMLLVAYDVWTDSMLAMLALTMVAFSIFNRWMREKACALS